MPSRAAQVWKTLKEHHQAMNDAYAVYYNSGNSPSTSRNSSTSNNATTPKTPSRAAQVWEALKEHHQAMNDAYAVYYNSGNSPSTSRNSSTASSPRHIVEAPQKSNFKSVEKKPRNYQKAWKAIKGKVVEHHRSVNAAYAQTYGVHR
ncbi:hypothetical protein GMOD_00003445 [Pyrenophora seminiperda CCB06]|uniref:Uncharacterized protein n=1 Tax=Pyrenophora seminiperda CCB06 TaxID=1302712 RepID=A0A3M7MJ08_9PLEO|nr:hypothetical protein GMOD_00003445 [Pyrenophora seminiperda CCB06]